jgi:hypothetical protein
MPVEEEPEWADDIAMAATLTASADGNDSQPLYEDWETFCDKETLPAASHPLNLVRDKVKLAYDDDPQEFRVMHGHAMLAASRSFSDWRLRMKCLNVLVRKIRQSRPGFKAALFDLGSGASGVKQAVKLLRGVQQADGVYHHCLFPIASSADLNRESTLQGYMGDINWVTKATPPVLGKVNVCRHKASECECFAYYDTRAAMAVHAHYYFTDEDWRNVFMYVDSVELAGHMPLKTGRPVPEGKPEFIWTRTRDSKLATWPMRLHSFVRKMVFGFNDMLVFEPLSGNGTTYYQRDPYIDTKNGGFHMMPQWMTRWAAITDTSTVAAALTGVAAFVGGYKLGHNVLRYAWHREPGMLADAVMSAAAIVPWAVSTAHHWMRENNVPPPGAQFTVRIINGETVGDKTREPVTHFLKAIRGPLVPLEPVMLDEYRPDVKQAKELASMMLLTKKTREEARKVAAATCLRSGLGLDATAQTVDAAADLVDEIAPKNDQPPVTAWKCPPVLQALPYASAAVTGLALVGSTPHMPALRSTCETLRTYANAVTPPKLITGTFKYSVPAHCKEWMDALMQAVQRYSGSRSPTDPFLPSVAPMPLMLS